MLRFFILAGYLAAVSVSALAGHSPHADFVTELLARNPNTRYSDNIVEDAILDVPGLISKYGYPVEIHKVVTSDGYILTLHRIPHGRDQNNKPDPNKKVALVSHGLMDSSAGFVVLGPGDALDYLLAEEGYDVWLFNARGNFYSRHHLYLNPDERIFQKFWKFSWDEIGNKDLPAVLDYIEDCTGHDKLHYVGHSQGGTTFLVLNSLRPEYNKKFYSFQAMAPGAFFLYNPRELYQTIAANLDLIERTSNDLGRNEVFANHEFITWFAVNYCTDESMFGDVCQSFFVSGTSDNINKTMLPVFLGHAPAGASIYQFLHYGQGMKNPGTFRRYDFKARKNLQVYGRRTPPDYDLSKVTAPAYIHYAKDDQTAYYKDVEHLIGKLPNVKGAYLVDVPDFGHVHFVFGSRARELVYDKVVRLMKEAENDSL